MSKVQASTIAIGGQSLGDGSTIILDPFFLFKGKLRAAATRAKFHDSADLRWIESRFGQMIQAKHDELKLEYVGLAIKRYAELELLFSRIGIKVDAAKVAAQNLDPNNLPFPAPGDVQEGLLG